jgi:general secretion pathway protein J
MKPKSQQGFTLLEMLIALTLFALISLIGFQVLQGVLRSGELSRQHSGRLAEAQRVFYLFEQDIAHALPLPHTTVPIPQTSPSDGQQLRLLRRNRLNPGDYVPRASLEHVLWHVGDKGLQRQSYGFPRQTQAEFIVQFPRVDSMRLRYWLDGRWLNNWFATYALPQAIEVTLEIPGYGEVQRVIFITKET